MIKIGLGRPDLVMPVEDPNNAESALLLYQGTLS